jgi:hypothetical protein
MGVTGRLQNALDTLNVFSDAKATVSVKLAIRLWIRKTVREVQLTDCTSEPIQAPSWCISKRVQLKLMTPNSGRESILYV